MEFRTESKSVVKKPQLYVSGLLLLLVGISLMSCQSPKEPHLNAALYAPELTPTEAQLFAQFEAELEDLRQKLMIPALSAAIVRDQELVWAKGFGYADRENQIVATPYTPYHLASLTKPFAAVVILQLVNEGKIDLDDPVSKYGIGYGSPGTVRVRHLLTHTSEGQPGTEFRYNGDRFADLDHVIKGASGRSFRELLTERILVPLDMAGTAPNPMSQGDGLLGSLGIWLDGRNRRVYRELARPYLLDGSYSILEGQYPEFFTPAAGLISTVVDVAKFDVALDRDVLLPRETKEQMYAPTISASGAELPYGLGWFTQMYADTRLIWHYGWWPPCASSLILKVPDEKITFIVLANTDYLSRPYRLGSGENLALDSTVAMAFYRTFVFEAQYDKAVPRVNWEAQEDVLANQLREHTGDDLQEILERELLSYRRLYHYVGRADLVDRLTGIHTQIYPQSRLGNYPVLVELGPGGPPRPSAALPGMRHFVAAMYFVPIFLSMFVLWPIGYLVARFRARKLGSVELVHKSERLARTARIVAILAAVAISVAVFSYISHVFSNPFEPVRWNDGTPTVKILIGLSMASLPLSIVLVVYSILAWKEGYWSILGRAHYALVALAVLVGVYVLQDLGVLAL